MAVETTRFPTARRRASARSPQIETPCFIPDHVASPSLLSRIAEGVRNRCTADAVGAGNPPQILRLRAALTALRMFPRAAAGQCATARSMPFRLVARCVPKSRNRRARPGGFHERYQSVGIAGSVPRAAALGAVRGLRRHCAARSLDQARPDRPRRRLCDDHVGQRSDRLRRTRRAAAGLPVRRDGAVVGQLHHQRMARCAVRCDAPDQARAAGGADHDVCRRGVRAIYSAHFGRHAGGPYARLQFQPGRGGVRHLRRDLQCAADPRQGPRLSRRHRRVR